MNCFIIIHAKYRYCFLFMVRFRYALNILKSWDKFDIYLSTFHLPLIGFNIYSNFPCKLPSNHLNELR